MSSNCVGSRTLEMASLKLGINLNGLTWNSTCFWFKLGSWSEALDGARFDIGQHWHSHGIGVTWTLAVNWSWVLRARYWTLGCCLIYGTVLKLKWVGEGGVESHWLGWFLINGFLVWRIKNDPWFLMDYYGARLIPIDCLFVNWSCRLIESANFQQTFLRSQLSILKQELTHR